jgi:hypothetical protein
VEKGRPTSTGETVYDEALTSPSQGMAHRVVCHHFVEEAGQTFLAHPAQHRNQLFRFPTVP